MYYNNMYNQQVVRVQGEAGARAYTLPANSSALLLDQTGPYVWLVQTDGAGYKTASCYEIKPYTPAPAPEMSDIVTRLKKLEDIVNESHHTGNDGGQV